jgi:hypothetical protein
VLVQGRQGVVRRRAEAGHAGERSCDIPSARGPAARSRRHPADANRASHSAAGWAAGHGHSRDHRGALRTRPHWSPSGARGQRPLERAATGQPLRVASHREHDGAVGVSTAGRDQVRGRIQRRSSSPLTRAIWATFTSASAWRSRPRGTPRSASASMSSARLSLFRLTARKYGAFAPGVERGTPTPGLVAGARSLHLDHVGAEVAERHGAERAGEHPGEVQHAETGEWAGHGPGRKVVDAGRARGYVSRDER